MAQIILEKLIAFLAKKCSSKFHGKVTIIYVDGSITRVLVEESLIEVK